jgi:nitrile hydratase accessory protein
VDADLQSLFRQAAAEQRPFTAPWQAQAFSLTLKLHQDGHFAWSEWSEYLGRELAESEYQVHDPDELYHLAWLRALERMCRDKGLLRGDELAERKRAWDEAARTTEHGKPIELDRNAD